MNVSVKHVNLLTLMNLAWEQHIMWTRMLLISIADNLGDLDATRARLLQNHKDIVNIFRRYYGNTVANKIERLLTERLEIGERLIVTLKNNNKRLEAELDAKWHKNADEMADFFSSINPYYSREMLKKMFYEHLNLTYEEVNARLKRDYRADIRAFDKVQQEILDMSEFFVNGIVKQFLNLF